MKGTEPFSRRGEGGFGPLSFFALISGKKASGGVNGGVNLKFGGVNGGVNGFFQLFLHFFHVFVKFGERYPPFQAYI